MKEFNLKTGQTGERIAKEYLEKNGYKILEKNYRSKFAEIDLVAKKRNELIFVEVRTKKGELFGTPEDSLNKKKLNKLWWNAKSYASRIGWSGPYRIDAVCVVLKPDGVLERISHHENII
ncbi:MAG: YraN family protein [Candidatus Nealsonbacteria bacterium]|nr:YraN family protein [Candidatus Nealsonbacteria bacterium]